MRPLLLPGLLDAAAHNAAHGRDEVALFESARVVPARGAARRRPGRLPRRRDPRRRERHHLAAVAHGRAGPAGWRTPGAAGRLLLRTGAGRRAARDGGRHLARRARPSSRSCIRAARRRSARATARTSVSSASSTPRSRPPGSWRDRWPRSSSTSMRSPAGGTGRVPRRDELPGGAAGHGRGGAGRRAGRERGGGGAGGRGRPARVARGVRPLPRRAGGRRATSRSRCGSSSGRPTGRSPTRRWPSGARRSSARWRQLGGGLRA